MRVCEFDVQADERRQIRVYPIGDMHIEKVQFDERRFKRWVQTIVSDPHSCWVFVGDAVEGRTPDDPRYDADNTRPEYKNSDYLWVVQQKLASLFAPLKARPGVVVKGNHDAYQKWAGLSQFVAATSGGAYLDAEGMFRINIKMNGKKNRSKIGYARHVISGGRMPGAALNALSKNREVADADMYFTGHIHQSAMTIPNRYTLSRRGKLALVEKPHVLCVATSFLHGRMEDVVDYAGVKGLPVGDTSLQYVIVDSEEDRYYRAEAQL